MRPAALLLATFAACLASAPALAIADGVLPAVATPVQREQAQARFVRGKDLLAKKQIDAALAEFRASHEIVASPNTRLEIARCLRQTGKLVAAYAELGRTAVEAKELVGQDNRYQRALDSAMSERAEIEPQLGFVSLTIQNPSDDTHVVVGGEEIRRAAWAEPAPVVAGMTEIVVTTPGHAAVSRTITVAAGQRASLTVDAQSGDAVGGPAQPAPEPPLSSSSSSASLRPWAYVAGGVGAVGLITFAITGAMAKSTYDDLNGACHGGPCPPDKSGEISSGKTQQTVANVSLVLGIVGVAAGATLFVISMPKGAPASNAALVVTPGGLALRGGF
jgi:hypothetical protein